MYTSQNADVLGIKDVEEVNLKAPLYDTGELMRVGALVRLNVACQGTGGRKINYRIFCDGEEVSPALAFYRSTRKTLNGRTVLGANLDRRQVLR
ncbi:hypothetical protein [Arthrospira platensis]|nr:hypothetical protein [Arthrospira platensis]BAI91546.1 hypothetical protein NIES39_J05000 [Arthrospira platensis NIES-39]